jgi:RNA polymerase sigma-70 factor (ECF subfamily)
MLVVAEHEQLPVQEARAGNPDAWNALFKRYQLPLYIYVRELVHHEQSSLDIVQETFINAVRHIGGLQDNRKFGSWLFSIAHQKCIQHWRKRRPEQVLLEDDSADYAADEHDPGELLVRKEQEEQFMKLLNQLALPHRSVLLLHFVEDFSLEEIGRIIETPVGTVKSRLHYARKALRKLLEESES